MSGPLARSAHMRMKMKREKNGMSPSGPSPRRAPPSPAKQTVAKELFLAATAAVATTATLSSEVSEKEVSAATPQSELRAPSPRSLSSPVAIRSRSRSRSRPRSLGINSLETEGNNVVEAPPSPAAPPQPSPRAGKSATSSSPRRHLVSPTHPRSVFNSCGPRNFSTSRRRESYEFTRHRPQHDAGETARRPSAQRERTDGRNRGETLQSRDGTKKGPSSREEAFDPFAPSPLTVPDVRREVYDGDFFGYDKDAPQSAREGDRPHHGLTVDTEPLHHRDNNDPMDVHSPNHKDGGALMTIEGHDDNFVYPSSTYEDTPDFEYHTNVDENPDADESSSSVAMKTIDSQDVQTGTPVKKKKRGRKKKKKKIMIENVSADSLRSSDRYAIHNHSWEEEEDEENVMPPVKGKVRGHSLKYNEIVATAKRYEGMEEGRRKKEALSPVEGDGRRVVLPQRIGASRSWDSSQVEDGRPIASSKSWDAPSESESHGWRTASKKKQRNIWEDSEKDDDKSPMRRQFIGASKSWDFSGTQSTNDNGNKQSTQSDVNQDALFQSDPFGVSPAEENDNAVVKQAFSDWDGTGPEWADITKETEEAASDKPPHPNSKEDLDWNKNKGAENISNLIPVEFEAPQVSDQVSDYEEDEDSIFAFEKKEEEVKPEEPPPPPANPQDIFAKLNKGLKQAECNKTRALARGDQLSNADSDFSKDASEPMSEKSKPAEKRNVAFAKDNDNTIHTYLVEDSQYGSRESTSHVESTDDEEMETDPESSVDIQKEGAGKRPRSSADHSAPTNDGSASPRNSTSEQVPRRKKSVHYQSDEDTDTYHTNEESTMGSSFKSNRSGFASELEDQKELNLLDHVAGLAASLGGLFASPTNAAASAKEQDEKSFSASTDQDDTIGQSTLPSQDNTVQSDDWFGYMEKVLFPAPDETGYPDGERSVQTESEYTESNHTESQYSESQAQSSKYTYDDSYADEEDDEAYLLEQALASARAVHHIHGVEYDETQEIDVLTDVKFHVASIKLPLGLLFQEHEIGAWVSRVVPEGNGARKGVQHGDQLASINGKSAVHASIDEVAAKISRTPKNQSVELTFLRYVGPLKPVPGAVIQEGFEVTDSSVSAKTPPRPPRPSSAKSKSRFFTKSAQSSSKSPSVKQLPSSPSSPREAGESNARSIQKKKIKALGKMMAFKKSQK